MIIWNPWYGCHKLGHCVIKHDVNDIMAKVLAADVVCWATPIYYYEMSGQMKTLIDRMNAMYTQDYNFREVYLLTTAAENEPDTPKRAEAGLTGWIDCYPKCQLVGTVFCGGVDGPRTILDLFSFRESNQVVGEKEIVYNTQLFDYVVEQVSLIQNVIEDVIKPKLIIVKNKGAWVYFGLNPQFVWMGYQYQFVEEIACGKAYMITGFQASSDRVNNNRPTSNILGSYVIFTEHTNVANYPKPEDLQKYL